MSMDASEFYEAGLALPPSVRKDVALRLLDSVEGPAAVDAAWNAEISSRVEDILDGKIQTIPGEHVFAELAELRASRHGAQHT
ncbi:addiction module protein [Ruania albidiflava]|uniref:addiction module protein n=1 Tax=Ruania albidiflava TaxID=366586 RepID=UPI0003B37655|nr:addiction module protein [Ruania albidiflava]